MLLTVIQIGRIGYNGATSIDSHTIFLDDCASYVALNADFSADATSVCEGTAVTFTDALMAPLALLLGAGTLAMVIHLLCKTQRILMPQLELMMLV